MTASQTLSDDQLVRLAKLLRMLGSDQVGERATAALKVHALVTAAKVDWDELLRPRPAQAVVITAPAPVRTWLFVVEQIISDHYNVLRNEKEVQFVTDLLTNGGAPSLNQGIWLADLAERAGIPLWVSPLPPTPEQRTARRAKLWAR